MRWWTYRGSFHIFLTACQECWIVLLIRSNVVNPAHLEERWHSVLLDNFSTGWAREK